jgi:hypothetical protein
MSKLVEGQSVDYVTIHAMKGGLSSYPPSAYTPLKIDCGLPCDEDVTIVGECPYIYRYPIREKNHQHVVLCAIFLQEHRNMSSC